MPFKAFLLAALAISCLGANACAQLIPPLDEDNSDKSIAELLNTGKSPYGGKSPDVYHVKPDDTKEVRLMKQRINLLYGVCGLMNYRNSRGIVNDEQLFKARRSLSEARVEFHDDSETKLTILKEELNNAKKNEERIRSRYQGGAQPVSAYYWGTAYRLEVELRLLRLEKQLATAK